MKQALYQRFKENKQLGKKSFTVLIDPDKVDQHSIDHLVKLALDARVDYFFVGGSLVISTHLDECIKQIKAACNIPVILFPGSPSQVSKYADRSEEHTSELQSHSDLVCRLLLEKKKKYRRRQKQ